MAISSISITFENNSFSMLRLLSVCFLLFPLFGKTQEVYSVIYQSSGWKSGVAFGIIETNDNGYLVFGDEATSDKAMVIKLDASLNIEFKKSYDFNSGSSFYKLTGGACALDNGYILTGYISGGPGPGGRNIGVLKIDSIGNMQWNRVIGGSGSDEAKGVVVTPDSSYILAGETNSYGNNGIDHYYIKLDMDGNLLWTKIMGNSITSERIENVLENDSLSFFAMGAVADSSYFGTRPCVSKVDMNGNVIWSKAYAPNNVTSGILYDGIRVSDSNFVFCGKIGHPNSPDIFFLLKTDPQGDTIWSKEYSNLNSSYAYGIVETQSKGFIIVGTTIENSHLYAIAVRVDSTGTLLDSKKYGTFGDDSFYGITAHNDGTYIAVGSSDNLGGLDNEHDIYMAKMNDKLNAGCHYYPLSLWEYSLHPIIVTPNLQYSSGGSEHNYSIVENVLNVTPDTLCIMCSAIDRTVTDVSCFNGNDGEIDLTIQEIAPPYSYQWSTGDTTQDIQNLTAGTYYITVTDSSGCVMTDSITVEQPEELEISLSSIQPTSCINTNDGIISIVVNGGIEPYSIIWSNNDTTDYNDSLLNGSYSVTITDDCGAQVTDTFIITNSPPSFNLSYNIDSVSCYGGSDGAIDLTISGGNPPFIFNWSNSATSEDINLLTASTYSVTITDSCGAVLDTSIVVNEPTILTVTLTQNNISCNGGSDGSINSIVSGGTPGYTYTWSNSATTSNISNLLAGSYSVTITDKNGCSIIDSVTISEPPVLSSSTNNINGTTCFQGNDGSANVVASGGTPGYTYNWSSGETSSTATNLVGGTNTVTITDANGCTASAQVNVTQAPPINLSVNVTSNYNGSHISCYNMQDGEAFASASNGTPPYTYLWDSNAGNQTTPLATGLSDGSYSVTTTDDNGCTMVESVTLIEPDTLLGTSSSTTNFDSCNGTATITPTGGTTPYSYLWDATTGSQTTQQATGLCGGAYCVTVTDVNGCQYDECNIIVDTVPLGMTSQRKGNYVIIYPNPSTGLFNIEVPNKAQVEVYNTLGELVANETFNKGTNQLNLNKQPAGVYFTKIITEVITIERLVVK